MPLDYSGQNLQGRSFKGQNLTGANFSKADIRGANFTNAILKGADFTGAKAGLQRRWVIILLIIALLLLALASIYSIIIGLSVANIFDTKHPGNILMGVVSLVFILVFCIVAIRKGLTAGLEVLVILFVIASFLVIITVIAFPKAFTVIKTSPQGLVLIFALFITFSFILFSIFIAWRIEGRYDKDSWLDSYITALCTLKGTSFHSANLINADFTGATLKNTDFRKANLTRTRFYEAKKLDFARPGKTILSNPAVLNLLVTLNGRNKSYAGANLKGANLIGADLKEANLKDANIFAATFQEANLEWTNLTFAQAVGTNFTKAQMTGTCVEAWNIESTTILDHVDCRFVYLLEYPKPGTDNRERRPSSGEFQPGEFTKLFEEVLNTVDLIFRDGINWQAFVTAFKKVQVENGDTELAIQSIENKGDGVFVVKVSVPGNADKEKIHRDFTQSYQLALAAVEEKYKSLLQAKDEEINFHRQQSGKIPEMIISLANKPMNIQIDNKVENKNMTNSNDSSRNVEVEMNIQKVDGGVAGKVMGNQVITPKQNLADSASEIQQLLQILNQSYPADIPTDTQAEIEVAVKGINKNPQLKERVIGALKAGGIEAIKELADNIYVNVLIAAYDGWKNPQS